MPEWAKETLAWLLAPTGVVAAAVGWWFKTRHDDRISREIAQAAREAALHKEVKDGLNDRIRDEVVRRQSTDQTMQLLQAQQRLMEQVLELLKSGKGSP